MAATVEATYSSVQGDGGHIGKGFTTDTTPSTDDWALLAIGYSSNGNVVTAPGGWTEVALNDNVITTSGGQFRLFKLKNPADNTAYDASFTSGRQSAIGAVVRGADGTDCIDVKASLETGVGTSHAAPSVTPTDTGSLVIDFAFHRQFSPDTSDWTPPASGLTWTELKDVQGADGNNNVRMAMATATAGTGGVAISTAAWTKTDANEQAMVIRVVIKTAAGGATDATVTPSTVAAVASVPSPAVATGSTVAPATVAAAAAVPAPAVAVGSTVTPATVTAVAAVPAPAIATGSTVLAAVVAAVAAIPTPGITAGGTVNVTPSTVAAIAAVPAPAIATGSRVAPAAVAALAAVPAPAITAVTTVLAVTVAAVAAVPATGVSVGVRLTVLTVAAVATVYTPVISTPAPGLVGEAHGPLPLALGAVTAHAVNIAGSIN